MIHHYPQSIEDACADEYAARCSEAERMCRWLAGADPDHPETVRGAAHVCDRLVRLWAEFALTRDTQRASVSPIHPRFLS